MIISTKKWTTHLMKSFLLWIFLSLFVSTSHSWNILTNQDSAFAGHRVMTNSENVSYTGEKHEMQLNPFQLVLEFDHPSATHNVTYSLSEQDEMAVLSTTQIYLSHILKSNYPSFIHLTMFQFVRDFTDSDNIAKIALDGSAFFSMRSVSSEQVQMDIMMGFVEPNVDNFLSALHWSGMWNVINVTLMSVDGKEMDVKDGEMVEKSNDNSTASSSTSSPEINDDNPVFSDRDMSDNMQTMTLLLCLLIPGIILCVACIVFGWRMSREINWIPPKNHSEIDPVWQRNNRQLQTPKDCDQSHQSHTSEDLDVNGDDIP